MARGRLGLGWRGVEPAAQKLPGCREPVVRLEVGQAALHHVDEEPDGVSAVVGFLSNQVCELLGVAEALRTAARRRRDAEAGARAGGAGAGVDEALGGVEAEADELPGGAESVAWLGAFEVALHGGDEESDDESTLLSLMLL